jgi:cytochrome c oxidase subunit 2
MLKGVRMSLAAPGKALLLGLLGIIPLPTYADYVLNMTPGVTEISRGIHQLHMTIFWVCVVIGAAVFSVMFYAIIQHRKSRGVTASHFHESLWVEITWTLIPFTILILMAIPAAKLLIKMNDTERDSSLSIKIIGHQWYWEYEYLGEGVRVVSHLLTSQDQIQNRDTKSVHYLREVDAPLVVPEKQKIRFLTTANDVIHSWWVPAFGIKKDAIPGFINEAWAIVDTPGTYRGQCAELCGAMHGFMPIVVEVKSAADYQTWLQAQKAAQNKQP